MNTVTFTGFQLFLIIVLLILVAFLGYQGYMWLLRRRYAETLHQDAFRAKMHQAQVIDVREPQEFDSAHILGARNIPYSQAKTNLPGLNKKQPIFLYDNGVNLATRMARLLNKRGYEQIFILGDGFSEWRGKTKRKDEA